MTTKPIAVWICIHPDDGLIFETVRPTKKHSQFAATEQIGGFDWCPDWHELSQLKYRCKRFILSEAEGENGD